MTHQKTGTDFGLRLDFNSVLAAKPEKLIFAKEFYRFTFCVLRSTEIYHISESVLKNKILEKMTENKSGIVSRSDIIIIPRLHVFLPMYAENENDRQAAAALFLFLADEPVNRNAQNV